MFQPNKKFNLNEGREITDGALIYGGFPRILNEAKKAKKDYDKDGKLETSEEEWRGSVDRAIKAKMGKKVEESFDATDFEIVEDLLEELFDENELDLIIEAAEKKKWIQKAIKKEGSLRKTLKVKKGETIPEKKLEAAAKKGGKTGKRARLAMTLRNINESKEMRTELEKHLDALSSHGQNLHNSNHPNRKKYGEALNAFTKGNYNNADELISMGADPTAVGKYIAISTNPEYQKHMKQVFATVDPSMGGIYSNE